MIDLPKPVAEIIDVLASLPGTAAVLLGGSRALGINDAGSDWDLGVYYRGAIELTALSADGNVFPPAVERGARVLAGRCYEGDWAPA